MRRSATAVRVLVTAVSLLLSALLAADSAAAQVTPVKDHGVIATQDASASPAEDTDSVPDNCATHRGASNPVNTPAPAANPLHTCVCHAGPATASAKSVATVTGSEGFSRARTVQLAVLHQVFRC
jgi:hypothetical protein